MYSQMLPTATDVHVPQSVCVLGISMSSAKIAKMVETIKMLFGGSFNVGSRNQDVALVCY